MDITKLSLTELKALCFDEGENIKLANHNIQVIYTEMNKRTELQKDGNPLEPVESLPVEPTNEVPAV